MCAVDYISDVESCSLYHNFDYLSIFFFRHRHLRLHLHRTIRLPRKKQDHDFTLSFNCVADIHVPEPFPLLLRDLDNYPLFRRVCCLLCYSDVHHHPCIHLPRLCDLLHDDLRRRRLYDLHDLVVPVSSAKRAFREGEEPARKGGLRGRASWEMSGEGLRNRSHKSHC